MQSMSFFLQGISQADEGGHFSADCHPAADEKHFLHPPGILDYIGQEDCWMKFGQDNIHSVVVVRILTLPHTHPAV